VQKRLRQGFSQYGITYVHRRSEPRTPRNAVTAATIGRWLCSFHGDLQTATRKANDIFFDDDVYGKVFRTGISAEHVYLVTALSQAIDSIKYELKVRTSEADATESEKKEYEVLKYSLSKHFVLFLVGNAAEEIMQARVADLYEWKCKPEVITSESKRMINAWSNALHALLPQIALLVAREGSAYDVSRSLALSKKVADELKALLRSLESALGIQFADLREKTTV
jgi:hypothetical protein